MRAATPHPPQGFSPTLFPLFPRGDPRANVTGPAGEPAAAIASPKVAEAVRAHFGCDALAGAFLEDEGGGGSTGSHWEARLFQGELMLASAPFAGARRRRAAFESGVRVTHAYACVCVCVHVCV
jgi:hypothetical protein